MSIKEKAIKNFTEKKYNCCQAVVCAYCEENGIDDETIFKMTEGFGLGMAQKDTCGAVTGMYMALSMQNSAGDKENPPKTKLDTYEKIRNYSAAFEEMCGSIYCRELKSVKDGKQIVSCITCVEKAAELVEKFIAEN